MTYLANAFSLQMLNGISEAKIGVRKLSADQVCQKLQGSFVSVVGHEATAQFLSELFGVYIPFNRLNLKFEENDVVIVAQYTKGRLNGEPAIFKSDDFSFYEVKILERRI